MDTSIALDSISELHNSSYDIEYDSVNNDNDDEAPPLKVRGAIYGRSSETAALREVHENLLKNKQAQTVIVCGKSGSGKSALIDTLRSPVVNTGGYFVSGKYFQNATVQEPYLAIMAAFSDLCDLIVQSYDFDELKRRHIADALGAHTRLLEIAISSLTSLTGEIVDFERKEAPSTAKFKLACKEFLYVLASKEHPLVVFLDNVQWADEGSAALIQMFLQDASLKNVMFILAYRKEESQAAEAVLKSARDPTEIAVENLDADAVLGMVTAVVLGPVTDQIQLLSDLVMNRTDGNPFHVSMFMDTIQQEGLLIFDSSNRSWHFNVDEIQRDIMVSETLADLLTRKIVRLSSEIKETLKVASLLGYLFEEAILQCVVSSVLKGEQRELSPNLVVDALLSEAAKEGFIEKTSDGYQFACNKLQTAFQSLIDQSERDWLHQRIGEAFLTQRNADQANIYRAAVQPLEYGSTAPQTSSPSKISSYQS